MLKLFPNMSVALERIHIFQNKSSRRTACTDLLGSGRLHEKRLLAKGLAHLAKGLPPWEAMEAQESSALLRVNSPNTLPSAYLQFIL